MRISRYRESSSVKTARKNRLEIVAAQLSRREMVKFGLIGAGGYLVFKDGLSHWASGGTIPWGCDSRSLGASDSTNQAARGRGGGGGVTTSPPTRSFIEPLPIPAVRRPVSVLAGPAPTIAPNTAGGEGRTRAHQAFTRYPSKFPFAPAAKFETHQRPGQMSMSPDLPMQPIWGHDGVWPAPTYHARYGEQILVRNFNELPPPDQNGGFGIPEVSTHLHNLHSPFDTDGVPCAFFGPGQVY